jgi:hypothetical protein
MSNRKRPHRQIVISVHPDTKDRIDRCAAWFTNKTPSSILEGLAHSFEDSVLAATQLGKRPALTAKQRAGYFAGKLTLEELGGKTPPQLLGNAFIKELYGRADRNERVQLSLHVSGSAYDKLKRYCKLHNVAVGFIIDRHARRLEKYILTKLPEEERAAFLAGKWGRELPSDLITEPFNSNDNAPPEAA